ncbi:3'-5' exonuclease [Aurantimonas sp. Leaf443]|uniref:3'-5' exonuclease n=1 Tax=Aurantimonas sp. Leaf443 TaxID=1736378 RepID=UPI0006FB32D0|nr:3'-5' exonuclease [Aurantimonas sp. Leaf443]KQT86052.1 hypothetical protein ASG48_05570 [Aurantimonas sp. Leaf443]
MTVIALDFETANAGRDSACAVGAVFLEDGVVTGEAYSLIRPKNPRFDAGNVAIHGITARDVAGAPDFVEAMAPVLKRLPGALLLAHNAAFDLGVLRAAAGQAGLALPAFRSACTVALARHAFPTLANHKLPTVAAHLGLTLRHHHAGDDALACARIALAAAKAAGTASIAHHAGLIGKLVSHAPGRAAVPAAGGLAARALKAAGLSATVATRFVVRGSTGTPYNVDLTRSAGGALRLSCDCRGAMFGRQCRHVKGLLRGEVDDLLSGNAAEVAGLARRLGQR